MTFTSYLKGLSNTIVKYKYILIAIAAGMFLLLWPFGGEDEKPVQEPDITVCFDLTEKEGKLALLLSSISGVGKVEVMLTLESDMEYIYATQTNKKTEHNRQNEDSEEVDEEYVIIENKNGAEELAILKTVYPKYLGAVIVCEGGDNASVKWSILRAVSSLTGLSCDKITIVKMK